MSDTLILDQDSQLFGTVVASNVCTPHWDSLGKTKIYSIEIKPHKPGFMFDFGLFWEAMMGMDCLNGEQTRDAFINSQTVVLETIVKPMCSGAESPDGEFLPGQDVRVSCRYELSEPVLPQSQPNGYYQQLRILLRFVDTDMELEINSKETGPIFSTASAEQLAVYDF